MAVPILNLVDPDGTTALTLAILNGHFDAAVALLEKGANPNIPDKNGMTALYAAVDMNTIQTVWGRPMPLLEDADRSRRNGAGRCLAHRPIPTCSSSARSSADTRGNTGDASLSEGTTALARAAKSGDAKVNESAARGRRQSTSDAGRSDDGGHDCGWRRRAARLSWIGVGEHAGDGRGFARWP